MKKRSPSPPAGHSSEFKGVVKKITGKLTNDPQLEIEGRKEMLGRGGPKSSSHGKGRRPLDPNPDPHRRG